MFVPLTRGQNMSRGMGTGGRVLFVEHGALQCWCLLTRQAEWIEYQTPKSPHCGGSQRPGSSLASEHSPSPLARKVLHFLCPFLSEMMPSPATSHKGLFSFFRNQLKCHLFAEVVAGHCVNKAVSLCPSPCPVVCWSSLRAHGFLLDSTQAA